MEPIDIHSYFEATGSNIDAAIPALTLLDNKIRNGGRFFLFRTNDRVPTDTILDVIRQDAEQKGISIHPGSVTDCYHMKRDEEDIASVCITNWSEKEGKAMNQGVRITITAD